MSRFASIDVVNDLIARGFSDLKCDLDYPDSGQTDLDAAELMVAECIANCELVDAVQPVRCCKCRSYLSGWCGLLGLKMDENDYCSYGKRKEDENDRR